VLRAKAFFLPSLNVSAVAAPSSCLLEDYPVTLVITVLETVHADDARGICSAIEALGN
jgi:hypothetical protein